MVSESSQSVWTVIVPGLDACVDELCASQGSSYKGLNRWLSRSEKSQLSGPGVHAAIGRVLTGQPNAEKKWAPANITYEQDFGVRSPPGLVRADPVHLAAGADRLLLFPAESVNLSTEESTALVATLNEGQESTGAGCVMGNFCRWYFTLGQAPRCDWTAPECVEGKDILAFLPEGQDGVIIRRLLNDVQMLLHNHPVNEARRNRGEAEINSIWPWGWSTVEDESAPLWRGSLIADNPYAQGLVSLSGCTATSDGEALAGQLKGNGLVIHGELEKVLRSPRADTLAAAIADLEKQVVQPLMKALQKGTVSQLRLLPATGYCYSVRKADLWKFWRKRLQINGGRI